MAIIIGSVAALMGWMGGAEAARLLEAIIPTSRLFCSSILTVSATILALMLTMISLGCNVDMNLADAHYERIIKIAFFDAILFAAAAIMFVLHCAPVYESDKIPSWWYPSIYYGVLAMSALLSGGAVAIVTMLYLAVKDLTEVIGMGKEDHQLVGGSDCVQDNSSTDVKQSAGT